MHSGGGRFTVLTLSSVITHITYESGESIWVCIYKLAFFPILEGSFDPLEGRETNPTAGAVQEVESGNGDDEISLYTDYHLIDGRVRFLRFQIIPQLSQYTGLL